MSRVLVTGATGFVGGHLCGLLDSLGHDVIGTTRSDVSVSAPQNYELRQVAYIGDRIDWGPVLENVEFIVHLAARVHVMREVEKDPLAAFRRVNVEGTRMLLCHEGMRDVKRVIYASTVKVYGDETREEPFSSIDDTSPSDPYAISKLEAERLVEEIGASAGFETTVIRPPLVYGPGVGGNFARLLGMIDKGIPLPLGSIRNVRSLVNVENLCDLIRECLSNPAAPGGCFLVSDNHDLSTPDLIRLIASSMSRPARLIPIPDVVLRTLAKVTGRSAEVSRLMGSLQVDIGNTMQTLDWGPPVSLADGIQSTVSWYKEGRTDA